MKILEGLKQKVGIFIGINNIANTINYDSSINLPPH